MNVGVFRQLHDLFLVLFGDLKLLVFLLGDFDPVRFYEYIECREFPSTT